MHVQLSAGVHAMYQLSAAFAVLPGDQLSATVLLAAGDDVPADDLLRAADHMLHDHDGGPRRRSASRGDFRGSGEPAVGQSSPSRRATAAADTRPGGPQRVGEN